MDKRTKVLFVLFMVTLVVMGGALCFSHNRARPVADPNGKTSVVEPVICAEGRQVALFEGDVTAVIFTDIVEKSTGNVYRQVIFVDVYVEGKFEVKIETLGGELLKEFMVGDNDGYDIESARCVSPDPAVIITVKHGSQIERAKLISDIIRR